MIFKSKVSNKKVVNDQGDTLPVLLDTRRRSTLYLRLIKFLEEHPVSGPLLLLLPVVLIVGTFGWLVGGLRPPSFKYVVDASRTIYLDLFGGEQQLTDATNIAADLARFTDGYDSYDVAATSLYDLATSVRRETFESILKMPNGKVRILVLDPRLAFENEGRAQFIALSRQFGDTPQLTLAECLVSTFALGATSEDFKQKYGNAFEVRFYRETYPEASKIGYYILGRSYQKYSSHDLNRRIDIIIPYNNPAETGVDSPFRIAWRIKDRPDNARVLQYTAEFKNVWNSSIPSAEVLGSLPPLLTLTTREKNGGK